MKVGQKALIVEGGATRGAFSCGVLDTFLEQDFSPFNSFWGVSAGASNLAAYLAKMPGRNYKVYTDYSCRPEFLTPFCFLFGGDLMNIDWLWDITVRELGLDLSTVQNDKRPFFLAVTRLEDGKPEYHLAEANSLIMTMKASSAMPFFYKSGVLLGTTRYVDGGVADSIPIKEVIRQGANEIMVIRSRPASYKKSPSSPVLIRTVFKKTPGIVEPLLKRSKNYNTSVDLIRNPPEGIKTVEMCPPENLKISRLTRDKKIIDQCYNAGIEAGHRAIEQWGQS